MAQPPIIPGVNTAKQQGGEPCVHCHHDEAAHQTGQMGVTCFRCLFAVKSGVDPDHRYEKATPSNQVALRQSADRVSSLTVGATFNFGGNTYTVHTPCTNGVDGTWICLTHGFRFESNTDKDDHCYGPRVTRPLHHLMVWACTPCGVIESAGVSR